MPAQTLPTFTKADLAAHTTSKSCYVVIKNKVYDVTEFLSDHPGGEDLILDYAGKDIESILEDELSHKHSEAAYEILDEYLIGYLVEDGHEGKSNGAAKVSNGRAKAKSNGSATNGSAKPFTKTGMTREEELSIPTDIEKDYKTHKFIDLNKPMLMQVWRSGWSKEFYLDQVHRPRHYKGGESAPVFGNFLEPLSKTPWWMIPLIWIPAVSYGMYEAYQGIHNIPLMFMNFLFGLCVWSLVEYTLHRCLFHIDERMPDHRVFITMHFLLHGIHHYLPMDKYRLVMPPALFLILATPFWYLVHWIFSPFGWHISTNLYCGGIFGYICYDLTHYFLHHKNLPAYYKELKKYHLQHHFADYQLGFGVTSKFWDKVFGTELIYGAVKTA
ncbi:inositolphosphorylceramide-B C-26 hydroxylase [Kalaharituber pfeilii]|nr:inositolphosphorylceramide-B C-26 hydroxylase [Kalaharituber pfeilii]